MALLVLLMSQTAHAEFGVTPGSFHATYTSNQAGARGDFTTSFTLNQHPNPPFGMNPDDNAKFIAVKLPPGVAGNPQAYPQCSAEFLGANQFCPPDTQIGVFKLETASFGSVLVPLYNMVPQNGHPAELAFDIEGPGIQIHFLNSVRSSEDYGITTTVPAAATHLQILGSSTTIWGVPAAHIHDGERGSAHYANGCLDGQEPIPGCSLASGVVPPRPFLSNPTRCNTTVDSGLEVASWQNRDQIFSYSEPQEFEGCNQLEFEPTIEAKATTNLADSPSGLEFNLNIPQSEDPDGLATAHLKDARVTLPQGLTVNPASANGLGACTPAQIGMLTPVGQPNAHFTDKPSNCPADSRIGTVQVDTPLLGHPVPGSVYLASQGQNPFGSLLAIYLAIEDDQSELVAKIPAKVEVDPNTGRLTTVVTENPQLPFEDLHLSLFKGSGAPLKTAIGCGTFMTTTDLTPWSTPEGADAFPTDSFAIDRGAGGGACVGSEAQAPNKPSFSAGTADPIAGAYSPFTLRLARADGTQQLTGIDTTLPKGLIAKLAGTTYCSEAALAAATSKTGRQEQASPSCPASSRVGTVNVGAGAGPTPYYAQGSAYLAGPYKGAPLSLAVITPAVAGPFDLGTVVVRTALQVNPETAEVRAVSDPFPSILQGIPLDIRSVAVNLDRSAFTRNPTSCDPMAITGSALSLTGQSAALSNPFQVGDCAKLAFKPKLSLELKGGTKRGDFPALRAVLKARDGEANISRVSVALPHSVFLEQGHIGTVCTRVQFAASQCPARSVYGHARAFTPLLDKPLEGPVYLRSSSHKLPDLVVDLHGQLDVALAGRIDSVKGGAIRSTFEAVPDAAVSKFVLEMQGGKKGLLQNSRNLCANTYRATVLIDAQNGKTADQSPALGNECKAKSRKKQKHSGR